MNSKQEIIDFLKNNLNKKINLAKEKYLKLCNKKEILKEAIYV